jgi:hypothetical protein
LADAPFVITIVTEFVSQELNNRKVARLHVLKS